MSDGIILSEKYGVNPSIEKCFLCEKEIGLVMFGKLPDDVEAPKICCLGHICEDCENRLKEEEKAIFIELNQGPTGRYIEIPTKYIESKIDTINYLNVEQFKDLESKVTI